MTTPPPAPPAQIVLQNTRPLTFKLADGYALTGELSLPPGAKPGQKFRTVILLHGSGPNDLNETLPEQVSGVPGGSKVFLQLARQLNEAGFAVVRYNKRGVLGAGPRIDPAARPEQATVSQFSADALGVLQTVRTLPEVNPGEVFLLGHSEGTMLAARIAREHPELVRGLVLIGTVGYTFRETLHFQLVDRPLAQVHELMDADHDGFLTIAELTAGFERFGLDLADQASSFGVVQKDKTWTFLPEMKADAGGRVRIDGPIKDRLEAAFAPYPNLPDFGPAAARYFKDADAYGSVTQNLPGYGGPVLMLHGAADPQTILPGAKLAQAAAEKAGNKRVKLIVYPGLGHSLSPLKDGRPTLGWMDAQPLNDLTTWLKAQK